MIRTTLRRLGVATIAPALAFGAIAAAPAAQAAPAPPNSYAYAGARWLDDQLTGGFVHNPNFGGFDDYGLSLDVFFALDGLGTRATAATSIIDAFEADPTVYTSSDAYGYAGSLGAGASGKLASAVIAAERDPGAFGGHDLIAEIESTVVESGSDAGRARDVLGEIVPPNEYPNVDYSNTIGQSWVVRALSGADSDKTDETVGYLLKQQCDDGSFRSAMEDAACTTGAGTIDATAFAVQSLSLAKDAGQPDLQDDIDDAVEWLLGEQGSNGSFLNDGSANTNSTGLAAATLKIAGEDGAAGSAAAWIVRHQVTDAVGEDTALGTELGAIAFDEAALQAGKVNGITDGTRDQWIRATAQAAVGVNAQLPAKTFTVTGPTAFVQGGKKATVAVSGLARGEKFSASIAGGASAAGTADASGNGSVAVTTPTKTGTAAVTVTGARSTRKGTTSVKVLGARTLSLSLKASTVKKGKTQTVKVSRLVKGEPVTIRFSGKNIRTAKAYSNGTYTYAFKVGSSAGKKTVKVTGAFSNRTASKTFKVK